MRFATAVPAPLRLNVPSRLKGMETFLNLLIFLQYLQGLNVRSRLKGMETMPFAISRTLPTNSLNVRSRLKGMETKNQIPLSSSV